MKSYGLWAVLSVVVLMIGCGQGSGKKDDKRPARTGVSGLVTYKGTPVAGATVTLHPIQKGNGAFGVTDSGGKFVLGTFDQKDGAVAGEYKVSVRKLESASTAQQAAPGDAGYNPNPVEATPKDLLPEKYADFTKSGLSANVGKTPITDLKFDLVD